MFFSASPVDGSEIRVFTIKTLQISGIPSLELTHPSWGKGESSAQTYWLVGDMFVHTMVFTSVYHTGAHQIKFVPV